MIGKGFSTEEVEAAKKSWLQLQQVSRGQEANLVSILTAKRLWNRTMAFDSELEKKVAALTPEQLQAAVRKHIDHLRSASSAPAISRKPTSAGRRILA